jgi:DNA-binding LacI/PurR family transcriptional regulator
MFLATCMDFMQLLRMKALRILSIAEQVAAHLRDEIARGQWRGLMPGRGELAKRYDVGITSVEAALRQLEGEGLLTKQGAGQSRRIVDELRHSGGRRLKIAILAYDRPTPGEAIFAEVHHKLREAGHDAAFTGFSMEEAKFKLERIVRHVQQTEADAWILCAPPKDIAEWFTAQPKPAFALFGRRRGVRIASVGPDKSLAFAAATRRLIGYGHHKIVMLCRPERRLPVPGKPEQAVLDELAAHGITPGAYHFPEWEDGMDGFQARLESLFRITPPTALIVDELKMFVAVQQFLLGKRLRVPEDVSLVSMDTDPAFEWCKPSVAHVRWDHALALRRVLSWANKVAGGKIDVRETNIGAEFIDGGTIGPAKRR